MRAMREREIVKTVAEQLRAEGLMDLKVRYKNERGPDIEGYLPRSRRRVFIEAKGERPSGNERAAVGEALLQILSQYDTDVVCAIALPFVARFQHLVRSTLPGLKRLGLHVLLVRDGEVWHLGPRAAGFFPSKPESLIEMLEQ